jgi:hypothetical protein
MQRRVALLVLTVHIGPEEQQPQYELVMPLESGEMKGGSTRCRVGCIDIYTLA